MKTININDELHERLRNAAEYCGISIQSLVKEMLEKQFNSLKVQEFKIDNINDINVDDIKDYIKVKDLREGEFRVDLINEIFKKPYFKLYYK